MHYHCTIMFDLCYYIFSKPYDLVKIVFLTLIVRPLSREPTHAHHRQRVNTTFVITYSPRGVYNIHHHRLIVYLKLYTVRKSQTWFTGNTGWDGYIII